MTILSLPLPPNVQVSNDSTHSASAPLVTYPKRNQPSFRQLKSLEQEFMQQATLWHVNLMVVFWWRVYDEHIFRRDPKRAKS